MELKDSTEGHLAVEQAQLTRFSIKSHRKHHRLKTLFKHAVMGGYWDYWGWSWLSPKQKVSGLMPGSSSAYVGRVFGCCCMKVARSTLNAKHELI